MLNNLELYIYIYIALLGFFSCFYKAKAELSYFTMLPLLFLFSYVIRFSGYEIDFYVSYIPAMKSNSYSIYYLKEPVFWLGSRFLYSILSNHNYVLIFFDVLCFYLLIFASRMLSMPRYFIYLFLLFFPTVLGMQNAYRQFVAVFMILIYIAFLMRNMRLKAFVFLLFAILAHNASIIFCPLIFLKKNSRGNFHINIKFILTSLLMFYLSAFYLVEKVFNTGNVNHYTYLVICVFIFLFYVFSLDYRKAWKKIDFISFIYLISLFSLISFTSSGGVVKRIGMFCLSIMILFLVRIIEERHENKIFLRSMIFMIVVLVITLFPATNGMILGVNSVVVE